MFKAELIDGHFREIAKQMEEISQSEIIFETEGDSNYQDLVDLLDEEGQAEFNCGTCRKFVNRVANLVYFEGVIPKALFWHSLMANNKDLDLRAKLRMIALRVERSAVKSVFWNKGGKVEVHPNLKRDYFVYHLGSSARTPFEHFHANIWVPPLTCLREYQTFEMEFKRLASLMPLDQQIRLLDRCCWEAKAMMPFTQNIVLPLNWTRTLLQEIWLLDGRLQRNSVAKLLARIPHDPLLQTMMDKFYSVHKESLINMLEEAQTDVLSAVVNYLSTVDPANANVLHAEHKEMSTRIHQVNHLRELGVHDALAFHNASLDVLLDDQDCIWHRTIEGKTPEEYMDLVFEGVTADDLIEVSKRSLSIQIKLPIQVPDVKRLIMSNPNATDTVFTWQDESKLALIDANCDWVETEEGYIDVQALVDGNNDELYLIVAVESMPDECKLNDFMRTLKLEYDHYRLGVNALLHIAKTEGRVLIAIPFSQLPADREFLYYNAD